MIEPATVTATGELSETFGRMVSIVKAWLAGVGSVVLKAIARTAKTC